MPSLSELVNQARADAEGAGNAVHRVIPIHPVTPLTAAEEEVSRVLQICNACRYCEGFCAVFPAMTRRLEFARADMHYLANLCHNCGACLHACQYAPPHEFAVNVPVAMAEVRGQTYQDYAWPPLLGKLYRRNGLALSMALALGLALFLMLAVALNGSLWGGASASGSFYALFPHNLLVALFAPVFGFVVFALAKGVMKFWREVTPATSGAAVSAPAAAEAGDAVLRLKYLDGGHGSGCNNADDAFTLSRRRFHHLTFYGFLLCFAATALATIYHYVFGWHAPYEFPSLPKLLGAVGGVSLALGTGGLGWLHLQRHRLHVNVRQRPMDLGFIGLLFLTAVSGLALWLGRATPAMGILLCLHLGAVMALFATLPYGKFAHGIFRTAALLRHAVEKRRPNPVGLGAD
ncbi:tricarballylate utilization 4Fe-4S protein TcuB [Cupriavidus oxalaticus]|uniref:tricarballylate utilization 4Fe-4S protein TcuB n=1 Tax=Cupriavidus oxalaticus TaxID=96344 RepID=UPI00316AF5BC